MASTTPSTASNSASRSAPKAERKRQAYRQWLLQLAHRPTIAPAQALLVVSQQAAAAELAQVWLRWLHRDQPGTAAGPRVRPASGDLPPLC